jgi:hypothetical protein
MLEITIQGDELWDEDAEQFVYTDSVVVQFEHSLVSLSKWEARFHKLFLTDEKRSDEEMIGYVEAMVMTPGIGAEVLHRMSEEQISRINDYINDPMTGTTISQLPQTGPRSSERISSELIYFWMSHYSIPYEARDWHLNRLFTLIKIHHAKNQKERKVPRQKVAQSNAEINAARRAASGSKG